METTRKIGDAVFTVSPLDFEATCDLLPLLAPAIVDFGRLFALVVGTAVDLAGEGVDVAALDTSTMLKELPQLGDTLAEASALVAELARKLPADSLRTIRRTLLRGATMNGTPLYATAPGQPDLIGQLLRGRTMDGWRLMLFALEVNYPDFFGVLKRPQQAPPAQAPSATS